MQATMADMDVLIMALATLVEIVQQMREPAGFLHESLNEFMRRMAERWLEQKGIKIPFGDPEAFLKSAADAGFVQIELDE